MDNEVMDKRILEAVKGGRNRFWMIDAYIDANNFRQVDRRLQALRKRRALKYTRKHGWKLP